MNLNDIFVKLIIFVIIILIGLIISKVVFNLVRKFVKEFEIAMILKKADIKFNPNNFIPSLSRYLILVFTIIIALNAISITSIFIRIIFISLIVILIAYTLISMHDVIPNIYYGFKVKKKYKVGDNIKYKKIEGKIIYMNLVEFQIKTKKEVVYIPYKLMK